VKVIDSGAWTCPRLPSWLTGTGVGWVPASGV
jgi:hypothetical protein